MMQANDDDELLASLRRKVEETFQKLRCGELKDGLFSYRYFGEEIVEKLERTCEGCIALNPQSRKLLAIVQATMTGKTRVIIELSMRSDRPIILMRLLTKDNPAFAYLINDIESKNAKKDVLSYDERRTHNRRIMLKVRIFFHCYTLFTKMFLDVRQKSWKDLEREERITYNALLLNGGTGTASCVYQ